MAEQPSKTDLEAVFQRLRLIPANKMCFDCGAKNPTWASVTYGVFICIDCSAVHRSLGVHLSFVRSTQLDTNWTWVQLRQMQVGGNGNAQQFFQQHNSITTDAQKKYNSRTANLYRDKVHQQALKAMQSNSQRIVEPEKQKLHIQPVHEEKPEEKEVDFFTEAENFTIPESASLQSEVRTSVATPKDANLQPGEGPKVDFTSTPSSEERKSTIGVRKIQPKKSGLGAKKGGLGATKVKTNFADLEREAALAEESRLRMQEENARAAELSLKEQEERDAAVRLAYKDLSDEQHKREQELKKVDPKKAEQMERLGMGFHARAGVSHSVSNDMQTIEQENDRTGGLSVLSKLKLGENSFVEDYYLLSMNRNSSSSSSFDNSSKNDFFNQESNYSSSKDNWVIVDDPVPDKPKRTAKPIDRTPTRRSEVVESSTSDAAQKKFGSAKAISSEQYFGDRGNSSEHEANLSRFQGSSSISSSEYFGNGEDNYGAGGKFQPPDLEDVRESFRQGVTKVAGRISSLANGVVSSLQERYGY